MVNNVIQSSNCFVCGRDNPRGLNLPFVFNDDNVTAEFTPSKDLCGFENVVHGGILFSLADEAMMHLIHGNNVKAITSEITIRMKRFAPVGEKIIIRAYNLDCGKHLVTCKAELRNSDDVLLCRATGKFLYYDENQPFRKSGL